jgi:hypothetical protein
MIGRAVEAEVLRLQHAERWPIGTIARQLPLHHSTVLRVFAQTGVPAAQKTTRPSLADPFVPFIRETLKRYLNLCASGIASGSIRRPWRCRCSWGRRWARTARLRKRWIAGLRNVRPKA